MRRGGSSLIEVVLALAIVAGPVLTIVVLIQANMRQASQQERDLGVRQLLIDLSQMVVDGSGLPNGAMAGESVDIRALLKNRAALLPAESRSAFEDVTRQLEDKISASLDPIDGGGGQLLRLELRAQVDRTRVLKVVRLFRAWQSGSAAARNS